MTTKMSLDELDGVRGAATPPPTTSTSTPSTPSTPPLLDGRRVARTIASAYDSLKATRYTLAVLYEQAVAADDDAVEHEVGECLTRVRAATKRVREAAGELAQMRFDELEG